MSFPKKSDEVAAKLAMSELSRNLGLSDEPQDWGIVNADSGRLEEFAKFLSEGSTAPTATFSVVDLVIASANERLMDGGSFDEDAVFGAVAATELQTHELQVEYWGRLDNPEEFPVAPLVRAWFDRRR